MNVGGNGSLLNVILRLEHSAEQISTLVACRGDDDTVTEKVEQQREKIDALGEELKQRQELFHASQELPQELSDLKIHLDTDGIDFDFSERLLRVIQTLKSSTQEILQKEHVDPLSETQFALSVGIQREILEVEDRIKEMQQSERELVTNEPKVIESKKSEAWFPWLLGFGGRDVEHKFVNETSINDQTFDLKKTTTEIFNGVQVDTVPEKVTTHGLTETCPAGFYRDTNRMKEFIFNSRAYIYTNPDSIKDLFSAQLIAELKKNYGELGAQRIMNFCHQSMTVQPLLEIIGLHLEDVMRKHQDFPERTISWSNFTGLAFNVTKNDKETVITAKIVMTDNPLAKIFATPEEEAEAIARAESMLSSPPDNSWGEYVVLKRVVTIPNDELTGAEQTYPQMQVEDFFSPLIEKDQKKALELLERF